MKIFFLPFYLTAGAVSLWCLACGFYDLAQRRLPNLLTLGMHVPALAVLVIAGEGFLGASITSCLLAWAAALVLTLPAYAFNWLGAGDAKFLAAIGLLTGLKFLFVTYIIAALTTGLVILIWLSLQRYWPFVNLQLSSLNLRLPDIPLLRGKILPFGAILALSAIITLMLPHLWEAA